MLSDAAGAGPRWNPDEGDFSRHRALAPRAFLQAYLRYQTPHTRPRREPLTAILATDELLPLEILGSLGATHPQRDRSLPRLEDHLEAEEGAALPLGGHKPHPASRPTPALPGRRTRSHRRVHQSSDNRRRAGARAPPGASSAPDRSGRRLSATPSRNFLLRHPCSTSSVGGRVLVPSYLRA